MALADRHCNMDKIANIFIEIHCECNVVYLGAGLETMCCCVNKKGASFYVSDVF